MKKLWHNFPRIAIALKLKVHFLLSVDCILLGMEELIDSFPSAVKSKTKQNEKHNRHHKQLKNPKQTRKNLISC